MSVRARHARRLASILTAASRVDVIVRYYRQDGRYGVQWTGGPSGEQMRQLAVERADDVPELDVNDLAWLRTEPTQPR
ncbi:hypothetical protein JOF56_003616 [Kibdelosporangium banguiense]|uniref:Uncharacterized protein n=1 Tax=Kibdelosporangium banguiense TaxID=1365924 RepID=A0ABS4THC6_9PSEU|nr:hypothetical protein [Kibdelosporangium banguiense]MBP2323231.1 hypothetical protein [Kibdelosporangium banguiense]